MPDFQDTMLVTIYESDTGLNQNRNIMGCPEPVHPAPQRGPPATSCKQIYCRSNACISFNQSSENVSPPTCLRHVETVSCTLRVHSPRSSIPTERWPWPWLSCGPLLSLMPLPLKSINSCEIKFLALIVVGILHS